MSAVSAVARRRDDRDRRSDVPVGGGWRNLVRPSGLYRVADVSAILLLAVEGALLGAAAGLNVFGVLVVSIISALGGGIIRDLLIHATPPAAVRSVVYPLTALVGGLVVIAGYEVVSEIPGDMRMPLDAAALGLLCVVGAIKALDHGMQTVAAVIMGVLGSVGGGVIRDVLMTHVPAALRFDLYAVAAAGGAILTVTAIKLGLPRPAAIALGVAACVAIRVVSVSHGWSLPRLTG
jgi:uncharacterized membrane protein YeiH